MLINLREVVQWEAVGKRIRLLVIGIIGLIAILASIAEIPSLMKNKISSVLNTIQQLPLQDNNVTKVNHNVTIKENLEIVESELNNTNHIIENKKDTISTNVTQNESMTMGIIVVPYFEPAREEWKIIYQQAEAHPGTIKYVIINPCSGPCGNHLSADWQQIISNLQNRGVKTLGYIFDSAESIESIDYYLKDPKTPTDGIFFDNEGSTDNLQSFTKFADYVHGLGGIVYVNPGFNYPQIQRYLESGAADVANIYEITSEDSHHITVGYNIHPRQLSVIVGNVYTDSLMQNVISKVASYGIGTVYVYTNSYDSLPAFFVQEVQHASTTNVKNIEN